MILLSTKSLFSNIEGPQGQDTSSSSFVGVRHFQPTLAHPPFTIYYPAATTSTKEQKRSVGWFHENGFVFYILGYLHMTSKYTRHDTLLFRWFLTPFIHIISLLFPARWIKLANVYENVPLDTTTTTTTTTTEKDEQYPVIFFSHGLTGTGEENSALLVAWAKRGYIVISIHHTDGSSCCVRSCTGTDSSSSRPTITSHPQKLYYDVPPPYTNYDATYRPKQVNQRANEIWKVYDYLVQEQQDGTKTSSDNSNNSKEEKGKEQILNYLPEDLSSRMNFNKVIAVGYSYGAATVALAALYKPNVLKGIIFLDGWFHIDVEESAGIEFNFPQEVFDSLSATTAATTTKDNNKKSGDDNDNGTSNNNVLKDIPSLFINSEQFQGYTKLWKATTALIENNQGDSASGTTKHQSYVLQGTGHYNFIDICFWIPNFVAKRLKPVVGIADPMKVYKDLVNKTSEFMEGLYNNDDMQFTSCC